MDTSRLIAARERIVGRLLAEREPGGWWTGELSGSALSTATALSTFSFYLATDVPVAADRDEIQGLIDAGIAWLARARNQDGGWGDTEQSYSNISTTMLVNAALHATGRESEFALQISAAEAYIESCGSIAGLRARYGRDKTFAVPILANCAMAGLVEWQEVAALPFEAACVPQRFYNLLKLPVVSYAIPALVAIGLVKFEMDPPWDPLRKMIRRMGIKPSLRVLEKMQPASGGFLEAVPLTSFVSMALIKSGRPAHPVVQNGIRFLIDSFRELKPASVEGRTSAPKENAERRLQGTWPIDTNLATWVTTLSINALAGDPDQFDRRPGQWQGCLDWLLDCRNTKRHPFTGAASGGWGWSNLSGAVPDADDTPGALLALDRLRKLVKFDDQQQQRIKTAAHDGARWLLDLQNRDSGWPTFCKGWGRLPFDRSGSDVTAHAIRALIAWRDDLVHDDIPNDKIQKSFNRSIERGFRYLTKNQLNDGSWLPLWFGNQDCPDEINPCYGTAKVLAAYRDSNRFDTREAKIGLRWLIDHQNCDGGWGGGESVTWLTTALGHSSVEETGLVTELLIDFACWNSINPVGDSSDGNGLGQQAQRAADCGIEWLVMAAESGEFVQPRPIGFYFAKLWYFERMYPLVFAAAAMGKAAHNRPAFSATGEHGLESRPDNVRL